MVFSAAGKGTLAKSLAEKLDFDYLDTGILYRAVALSLLQDQKDPNNKKDAEAAALFLTPRDFQRLKDHPLLRTEETSKAVFLVAAMPEVREILRQFQRDFARFPQPNKKGIILDGRDTGTMICPDAMIKFFITADEKERAMRRYKELQEKGEKASFEEVLKNMQKRDLNDKKNTSPAEDAIILETTHLSAKEVFQESIKIY